MRSHKIRRIIFILTEVTMGFENLVIVESSAKAKTIEKYLHSIPELKAHGSFKVMASLGHVRDLPQKTMGVDTNTWQITYENLSKKRDIIAKLKAAAKEARKVYLASDPDREGAAIAYHLRALLNLKRDQYERVAFHEITKKGIRDAFLHPSDINMAEVQAQEARRILDRVVGYELSPLLWRRFATSSLSAGRVQSAALKLIVDRAKEVEAFDLESFWVCNAVFPLESSPDVKLYVRAVHSGAVSTWHDASEAMTVVKSLAGKSAPKKWVAEFKQSDSKRNPPPPFVTSSLQQEAYQKHGIPAKRTMMIAQNLYEAGLITYMRTDSTQLSQDAQAQILAHVSASFGETMAFGRQFATKNQHAQEAHECIRPTNVEVKGAALQGEWVTSAHQKVYELIWKRAVASQMAPAEYISVTYDVHAPKWGKDAMLFRGCSKVLVKPGFLQLYKPHEDEEDTLAADITVWKPYLAKSEPIPCTLQSVEMRGDASRPPPLFNEPMLVKTMEKEGIGRPSTYATILDKVRDKGYVTTGASKMHKVQVTHMKWDRDASETVVEEVESLQIGGKERDRLVPTPLGERIAQYLDVVAPFLMDVGFTASMEKDLDMICHGSKEKNDVLGSFYGRFHAAVVGAQEEQGKAKAAEQKDTAKKEVKPSKVFASFARADIVQTKYGPALFERDAKRFVSLTPFLAWKSKTLEDVRDADAEFLLKFPMKIEGTSRTVAYGPYGLYVKDDKLGNIPMDKELWDAAYDGTLQASDIDALNKKESQGYAKTRPPFKKRAPPSSSSAKKRSSQAPSE